MASFSSNNKSRDHGFSSFGKPSPSMASSSSSFASTISSFSSGSSTFFARATSPPRVRRHGQPDQSSSSVRFSIDRPTSPGRSFSMMKQGGSGSAGGSRPVSNRKKMCMCSPTRHPGSFRCALHKSSGGNPGIGGNQSPLYSSTRRLNFRRSAMANSLVRICGVEGELVKRALSALIRPSSHQLRRREDFQPRPSRLSIMSNAEYL
ncbi:hypothetical protein SAY86_028072 [Trapa natans]|uniref:Serine-rich protein-like protein n=1 Tax=Trapa natans TaxID=22666 RepID=A0AAN7LYQ2_TRANT|nr:hypothetical protein SAY86_028072 [Trapa natans]